MSKSNQFLNTELVPEVDTPVKSKKRDTGIRSRLMIMIGMCFFVSMLVLGPASAAINLTAIVDAVQAFITIMPSLGDMVAAAVPTIMLLAVLAFVMKFFNTILDLIASLIKF